MAKSTWPKTADGTIDWAWVFDNAESGLIPLIRSAKTATALRDCTLMVARQLYTRKDDPPELARFEQQLRELIPDGTPDRELPRMLDAVVYILVGIKDERIRKAEEHVRLKGTAADEDQRDRAGRAEDKDAGRADSASAPAEAADGATDEDAWDDEPDWDDDDLDDEDKNGDGVAAVLAILGKRGKTIAAGGAVAAGLAVAVVATLWLGGDEEKSDTQILIDQMQSVSAGQTVKAPAYGVAIRRGMIHGRKAVSAVDIPAEACTRAASYFINRGRVIINGQMPHRVSPNILQASCTTQRGAVTLTWLPQQAH